jgi:hypothetical protein
LDAEPGWQPAAVALRVVVLFVPVIIRSFAWLVSKMSSQQNETNKKRNIFFIISLF